MDKKYMKCPSELPLIEAAKLLVGVGKKNLIVVDNDNYVLGTISASDILRRFVDSSKSIDLDVVSDVMETNYIFLYEGCTREEIIRIFKIHFVFYIPIIDKKRKLKDMVFLTDYL